MSVISKNQGRRDNLDLNLPNLLKELWKEGFFKTEKTFSEVKSYIKHNGNNPNEKSLHSALGRAQFLTRTGSVGRYKYIQSFNFNDPLVSIFQKTTGIKLLEERGIHSDIIKVSGQLFEDGHYSQAIFEAYKEINNLVKRKSGLSNLDGRNLMSQAFKLPTPILQLNKLLTDSDKDEQEGFMFLFMGAIVGIRNPKAHDHVIQSDPIITLEYLSFASLLAKRIDQAMVNKTI